MSEGAKRPRVLIADDDDGVGTAISRLLSPSCEVVGRAVDIETLFAAAMQNRPDVVLLDFSLPGPLNALKACRRLRAMTPDVKLVALTAHDDVEIRRAAYEAGCSGFVWKLDAATQLVRTIQALVHGRSPV